MTSAPFMRRPANYPLVIDKGTTYFEQFSFTRGGEPLVDFTGYQGRLHGRHAYGDSVPVINLTTENGGIILGGSAATLSLFLSASATAQIDEVSDGVYDLELYEIDSQDGEIVTKVMRGSFTATPESTR